MGSKNCYTINDRNDNREISTKYNTEYLTTSDFNSDSNKTNIPNNEKLKFIEQLKNKLKKEKNEEIIIEEIKLNDFINEIEKNEKIKNIIQINQTELNNIIYEGEDKLNKIPPLKFSNKKKEIEYYFGTFDNKGNIYGKGIMITKDENLYEGLFKNNLFNGKGIFINKDGNYYFGDWKNGKCEGKGKIILNNKILYEGDFKNNEKNGKGIEHYEDESIYNGQFENNEKNGYGIYLYKNNCSYEGNFKNNLFNGEGEFKWNDGRRYKGNFLNGFINGKGNFFWNDGSNFNGNYSFNIKQGFGIYSFSDGKKFYGNFINNLPHGKSFFEIGNRKIYTMFRYGKLISCSLDFNFNQH